MRLCSVNNKKALFHRWEEKLRVINPSSPSNGYQGGSIRYTNGIVEYENGRVESVPSHKIVFLDAAKLFAKVEREIRNWEAKQASTNEEAEEEGDTYSFLEAADRVI